MSPGIAAKCVRSQFSQAQRTVSNSGIQNAGIEQSRLQPTTANVSGPDKRLREAAAAAGGIGFWLMIDVDAQAPIATSSTEGTISTTETMAATCELWLASHRLCMPTLTRVDAHALGGGVVADRPARTRSSGWPRAGTAYAGACTRHSRCHGPCPSAAASSPKARGMRAEATRKMMNTYADACQPVLDGQGMPALEKGPRHSRPSRSPP